MKYEIFLVFILLLSIEKVFSEVFQLKKLHANMKSLRVRRRTLDNEDTFLENVYGDSSDLNYYYATLYLGKKKIPQTYILDTGSPTTTSPCNKCKSCGKHLNKPYEINKDDDIIKCYTNECNLVPSSSCFDHNCGFSISYSEGSTLRGVFNMQEVYLERINKNPNISSKSFKIPIGCTTLETHLFKTQLADGIMGLNNSGKSFVSLLYNQKVISNNMFSICFGQKDGYFSIGEIDKTYHKTKIEYVPFFPGESNFYIKINQIKIGEKNITPNYRGFIDSGTTISYLPNEIYDAIINEFKSVCNKLNGKCGSFRNVAGLGYCGTFQNEEDKKKAINEYWPYILFYFEGHTYNLTANDYYYDYNDGNRPGACLGFEGERASKITLGGTFMHGHDVIFDRQNQQIGFAVADCNRDMEKNNKNVKLEEVTNNEKLEDQNDKINSNNIIFYLIITFSCILILIILFMIILYFKKFKCSKKYNRQIDESSSKKNKKIDVIEIKSSKN